MRQSERNMKNRLANPRTKSRDLLKASRRIRALSLRTRSIASDVQIGRRIKSSRAGLRSEISKETIKASALNQLRNHGSEATQHVR
jgi:hypothetical protein